MGRWILILGGGVTLAVALALVAFSGTGCDMTPADGYDPAAVYPPRTDPIVLDLTNATPPTGLHSPGKLLESISQLPSRGGKLLLPSKLNKPETVAIQTALTELFGTPAAPKIDVPDAASHGLTRESLAAGSRVYKLQCVQCHGMTGDGHGPTSLWVYPPARDLRQGQFKFVTTSDGAGWPTRSDLHRILRRGIDGNSMPPFQLMTDADLDAVASYTLHLMFRGIVEKDLIRDTLAGELSGDVSVAARESLNAGFAAWSRQVANVATPTARVPVDPRDADSDAVYADQVRRGHQLFLDKTAACSTCHVDYGRASLWRYDIWGVAIRPPDLTEGRHRGGGEPVDLFHRIRGGIAASGMPPASQLSNDEVWALVTFLKALPDPRHLPADVRRTVYPNVSP